MLLWLSVCVCALVSTNGLERELVSKQVSSSDLELFSFAEVALKEYFRGESPIRLTSISRLTQFVDEKKEHRVITIHFQVTSTITDVTEYQCPVSIYEHRSSAVRALARSIICLSLQQDPLTAKPVGAELQRNVHGLVYPLSVGTTISLQTIDEEQANNFDEDLFERFQSIHQKFYVNEEEKKRRLGIFRQNLNRIDELNEKEEGTAVYGISHLTDLNDDEFTRLYLNERLSSSRARSSKPVSDADPLQVSPASFDWRNASAVTEVKNQGQCGSCWAFSVTGNIEGVWKVRRGSLISLSEQELVDCDKVDEGCNGGYMNVAFDQIVDMDGLMSEDDYKYEGKQHDQCQLNKTKIRVKIDGYVNITSDENEMAQWLANNAPISIGLNANMMQFYFRGVAHPHRSLCNPQGLNHGVLLVGYGLEEKRSKSIPYWIIKNSWGSHWGEKGYYRLFRGDGSCGVNLMCASAIVN